MCTQPIFVANKHMLQFQSISDAEVISTYYIANHKDADQTGYAFVVRLCQTYV